MAGRLVNVRVDEERLRKARVLRERGVTLSEVVREAIDERYAGIQPVSGAKNVRAALLEIHRRDPDPPDEPARQYDVHDAQQARRALRERLRRTRR